MDWEDLCQRDVNTVGFVTGTQVTRTMANDTAGNIVHGLKLKSAVITPVGRSILVMGVEAFSWLRSGWMTLRLFFVIWGHVRRVIVSTASIMMDRTVLIIVGGLRLPSKTGTVATRSFSP